MILKPDFKNEYVGFEFNENSFKQWLGFKSNGNIEFWEYDKNNFEKFKLFFRDYIHDENENAIYKNLTKLKI